MTCAARCTPASGARRRRSPARRRGAVGISRKLAAFHLDKLVEAGLLEAGTEPRSGPRVGRAPKVYRPAREPIAVCVPPRDPGLLAEVLLDALVSRGGSESGTAAAARVAEERGARAGSPNATGSGRAGWAPSGP